MYQKRIVAKKVRIWDINNGKWEEGDGSGFVITNYGERVGRVIVVGCVVNKFIYTEKKYSTFILDDGTDTVRVKVFEDYDTMYNKFNVGDNVKVIGRVKRFRDENYINAEMMKSIDIMHELLHRLEIIHKIMNFDRTKKLIEMYSDKFKNKEEMRNYIKEKFKVESYFIDSLIGAEEQVSMNEEAVKEKVVEILDKNDRGIAVDEIKKVVNASDEVVERVVRELLNEGVCFEVSPGKVRKV